jgi:hypothetical protein
MPRPRPIPFDLKKDFRPEWSKPFNTPGCADPYVVSAEKEAWVDETGTCTPPAEDKHIVNGYLTPSITPEKKAEEERRRLRRLDLLLSTNSFDQYWCVDAGLNDEEVPLLEPELKEEMCFSTKVVLFVMIAVIVHGMWTHWEESEKCARCQCVPTLVGINLDECAISM